VGHPLYDNRQRGARGRRAGQQGRDVVRQQEPNPFESLESAQEFMGLLREAADDAYAGILDDIAIARQTEGAERRIDALLVVDHKLNQLRQNILASLLLLNDLRTLRRLLLDERSGSTAQPAGEA
jgi:hypothetical protein